MNENSATDLKKISISSGKKSIFYNLNDICSIMVKNGKVICTLTNLKEIPILHDFETLKQLLLSHNFVQIGDSILINRNEIKAIRDNGEGTKIFTFCNMVLHANEDYSNLKKKLSLF